MNKQILINADESLLTGAAVEKQIRYRHAVVNVDASFPNGPATNKYFK